MSGLGGRSVEADDKRELLLDVAERVFAAQGHAGTTMAALAAEAGVTRPTVYAYFPSKEHVFAALVERVQREFLGLQEQADTSSPQETVRSTLTAYLAVCARHSAVLTVIAHQALVDPDVRRLHTELYARADRRHTRFLERLVAQGVARTAVPPALVAEAITGVVTRFAQEVVRSPERQEELAGALVALHAAVVDLRGPGDDGPPASGADRGTGWGE